MKPCATRLQLEAAVLGEVPEGRLEELDQHAEACARCRHELNWLRAETAMFAQRSARDEVSRLWEAVDPKRESRRSRTFGRSVLALAASILVAVVVTGKMSGSRRSHSAGDEPLPMSLETMSVDQQFASAELFSPPCFTPGFGIACEAVEHVAFSRP